MASVPSKTRAESRVPQSQAFWRHRVAMASKDRRWASKSVENRYRRYRMRLLMADSSPGPTSHTYFSQRLRLHYVDWGNPAKPPLLLVHGGRDHCRNWDWTAAALRDDWHVIAPDLRGHGDSQWSTDGSYTMAGYIYDLAQLVHQQRLAPVTIIAHSLGGNVLLRYGKESRAGDPAADGRAAHFRHARVVGVERAGHWLHHDRLDDFLSIVRGFLGR